MSFGSLRKRFSKKPEVLSQLTATEDEESRRQELVDLYKVAVEEYRFQVDLNWKRTQYFLALNVAILGCGHRFG